MSKQIQSEAKSMQSLADEVMSSSHGEPQAATRSGKYVSALESMSNRSLVERVVALWGKPELDDFLNTLIMDSRHGTRQGLPMDVVSEILLLAEWNKVLRAMQREEESGLDYISAYRQIDSEDTARRSNSLRHEANTAFRTRSRSREFDDSASIYDETPVSRWPSLSLSVAQLWQWGAVILFVLLLLIFVLS